MKVIEITEESADKMSELAEEMLVAGGKLMRCIESMKHQGADYRNDYRRPMSYRRPEDDRDDEEWGMRNRDRYGRYM